MRGMTSFDDVIPELIGTVDVLSRRPARNF